MSLAGRMRHSTGASSPSWKKISSSNKDFSPHLVGTPPHCKGEVNQRLSINGCLWRCCLSHMPSTRRHLHRWKCQLKDQSGCLILRIASGSEQAINVHKPLTWSWSTRMSKDVHKYQDEMGEMEAGILHETEIDMDLENPFTRSCGMSIGTSTFVKMTNECIYVQTESRRNAHGSFI